MYLQARSISSSIQRVGRLARPVPFRYRQSPSIGFSSGQATGSQRNSMPNSWASFRLLLAVWGNPRSRNSKMSHPRHWALRCLRCSWKLSWSHFWVWSRQMAPVLISSAPYKPPLFRLPIMGTSTGAPLRAHLALRGGVSMMMVASVNSTTVRCLPFRPRFSPLLLVARRGLCGPAHTWAVSTGSPSPSDTGVLWLRLPQYPPWLVDGSGSGPPSNPRLGSRTRWDASPSPAPLVPPLLAASFWDSRSGVGPLALGPVVYRPSRSAAEPKSRRLLGSLPSGGRWQWGVLPDPATGDLGPGGPSGRPGHDGPRIAVPDAGCRSNLCEPSLPPPQPGEVRIAQIDPTVNQLVERYLVTSYILEYCSLDFSRGIPPVLGIYCQC